MSSSVECERYRDARANDNSPAPRAASVSSRPLSGRRKEWRPLTQRDARSARDRLASLLNGHPEVKDVKYVHGSGWVLHVVVDGDAPSGIPGDVNGVPVEVVQG